MKKRLEKLHRRAVDKGHWQLASAVALALPSGAAADQQINVVGAMHEVGLLRNSMAPFWKAWRTGHDVWVQRCFERLMASDSDHWALAALLACSIHRLIPDALGSGLEHVSTYAYNRFDRPPVHVAVFARAKGERILAPVIELGFDAVSGEIVDLRRWRAVVLESTSIHKTNLSATGNGTYYLRARLPHGCWRVLDEPFEIPAQSLVAPEETLLREHSRSSNSAD